MRFDHCDAFALAIPKNASESIHAALAYTWPNGKQHRVHDHKLLKDILLEGDDFTRTHYCIAIVREPVERFVSAWWYLQWNTGILERQKWNPEENRPGTHQYLNNLETTLTLLEQKVKHNADELSVEQYWRQFYDLDYVFHPQWTYCATTDGVIPDYLHFYNIKGIVEAWPELIKKFICGEWSPKPFPKENSTPLELKKTVEETLTTEQIQRVTAIYEKDYRLFLKYF